MHTRELCELCSHKTLKAPQPSVSDEKTDFSCNHIYTWCCAGLRLNKLYKTSIT